MLGAGEFILQFRHLLLRSVQHGAEFAREPQISGDAMDRWAALQL